MNYLFDTNTSGRVQSTKWLQVRHRNASTSHAMPVASNLDHCNKYDIVSQKCTPLVVGVRSHTWSREWPDHITCCLQMIMTCLRTSQCSVSWLQNIVTFMLRVEAVGIQMLWSCTPHYHIIYYLHQVPPTSGYSAGGGVCRRMRINLWPAWKTMLRRNRLGEDTKERIYDFFRQNQFWQHLQPNKLPVTVTVRNKVRFPEVNGRTLQPYQFYSLLSRHIDLVHLTTVAWTTQVLLSGKINLKGLRCRKPGLPLVMKSMNALCSLRRLSDIYESHLRRWLDLCQRDGLSSADLIQHKSVSFVFLLTLWSFTRTHVLKRTWPSQHQLFRTAWRNSDHNERTPNQRKQRYVSCFEMTKDCPKLLTPKWNSWPVRSESLFGLRSLHLTWGHRVRRRSVAALLNCGTWLLLQSDGVVFHRKTMSRNGRCGHFDHDKDDASQMYSVKCLLVMTHLSLSFTCRKEETGVCVGS